MYVTLQVAEYGHPHPLHHNQHLYHTHIATMLNISTTYLISLLIVVPLQVVEDGRPHQQVGEGDDDKGQGANLL